MWHRGPKGRRAGLWCRSSGCSQGDGGQDWLREAQKVLTFAPTFLVLRTNRAIRKNDCLLSTVTFAIHSRTEAEP